MNYVSLSVDCDIDGLRVSGKGLSAWIGRADVAQSREDDLVKIEDRRRLLHVVTRDHRRGAETAALALHQALVSRGWNSQIVALGPSEGNVETLGVDVLGPEPLTTSTLRRLREVARSANLVIAHGSTTLSARGLGLVHSTPFVYVNIGDPRAWQTTAGRRW